MSLFFGGSSSLINPGLLNRADPALTLTKKSINDKTMHKEVHLFAPNPLND